jgi:predicted metal-dependent hydrolase
MNIGNIISNRKDKLRVIGDRGNVPLSFPLSFIEIEVNRKKIKNMYLRVSRQDGRVSISAPLRTSDEAIVRFAESKLDWIIKQLKRRDKGLIQTEPEYIEGEIHYVWGEPFYLEVRHQNKSSIDIIDNKLILTIRKGSTSTQRKKLLIEWYRGLLMECLPKVVEKWEPIIGVRTESVRVRNMTTRWGTCNTRDKRIWINLELAKKPLCCLEYVVVHELVHLLEPSHNAVFKSYMDHFLPDWRIIKAELNKKDKA